MLTRLIPLLLLLGAQGLCASHIIVTNDFALIQEACSQLNRDALVLFDVDATLIVPNDALLKPSNKQFLKELLPSHPNRNLFREIHMQANHSLVDSQSVAYIEHLQQQTPVIAFTLAEADPKNSGNMGQWRVLELKRFGFDFSSAFPSCAALKLPKSPHKRQAPFYTLGVLYTSLHPKSDVLKHFFEHLQWTPSKVVYIDDDITHINAVAAYLDQVGIPCIAIHYTAAEAAYPYNHAVGAFQINHFLTHGIWLSDQEALEAITPQLDKIG